MLIDELKRKEYYLSKLSMFARNSYGIEEQFDLFWKILTDLDSSIDDVFLALSMSFEYVEDMTDTIDKLAELTGTKRMLDVSYLIAGSKTRFTLNLSNKELLRLIQTRILQNNYNGTFEEFVSNYQRIGLQVLASDTSQSATVAVTLNVSDALTDNDKHLFLSGHYTIRSMGIIYEHAIQSLTLLAIWDSVTSVFDSAEWGD